MSRHHIVSHSNAASHDSASTCPLAATGTRAPCPTHAHCSRCPCSPPSTCTSTPSRQSRCHDHCTRLRAHTAPAKEAASTCGSHGTEVAAVAGRHTWAPGDDGRVVPAIQHVSRATLLSDNPHRSQSELWGHSRAVVRSPGTHRAVAGTEVVVADALPSCPVARTTPTALLGRLGPHHTAAGAICTADKHRSRVCGGG